MFLWRSLIILLFLSISTVLAQFENCNEIIKIPRIGGLMTIKYPSSKVGNCRYQILSPPDSLIQTTCSLILTNSLRCLKGQFSLSRSGDSELRDSTSHCGRTAINQNSIGNEVTIAYITNSANSDSFQCTFKAVAQTNANCDCGWNVRGRIVGGSISGVNEFVSHAGLIDFETKKVFCGAIIVSQFWSLTAAHCLNAYPNTRSSGLLTGDHDISLGSDSIWAALYLIEKYVKHGDFVSSTNVNDIALIKTKTYIKFTRGVGPACLPYTFMNNNLYFNGKYLTAVGWGTTEFAGPASKVLKKASLLVVNTQTCAEKNDFIDTSKICTRESQIASTCQQDSGGGLYHFSGRYFAIGIISYGTFCASNIPSVNTRITSYVGWIEDVVGGFLCRKA